MKSAFQKAENRALSLLMAAAVMFLAITEPIPIRAEEEKQVPGGVIDSLGNLDSQGDMGIMPLSADEISVKTKEQFLAAVKIADASIRLDNDITLQGADCAQGSSGKELNITISGLTIKGYGHKIIIPDNKILVLKSNGMNLSDVIIQGNAGVFFKIWNRNAVGLHNVTVQSRNTACNNVGLQIGGGAVVTLSGNFVTRNFKNYAIQVQNSSILNVNNLIYHRHYNGTPIAAVQLVGGGNVLTGNYYGVGTSAGANTNYAFPTTLPAGKVVEVRYASDFTKESNNTKPNILFDVQADVTLTSGFNITGDNIVIAGNGYTINNNGTNKITLKGKNQVLRQLNFTGYTGTAQGLQVYKNANNAIITDVTIEDVTFTAGTNTGAVGLIMSTGTAVTLKGKISSSGNKGAGIRRNSGGQKLDMLGVTSWESTGDKYALEDNDKASELKLPPQIKVKEDPSDSGKYYLEEVFVTDENTLKDAIAAGKSPIKLGGDFTVSSAVTFNNSVELDGNGKTITLAGSGQLVFQKTHEAANLTLKGSPAAGAAVVIDGPGADVTMTNVTIDGGAVTRATVPTDGVVISGGAKAAFEGSLTTKNHINTFRVKGASLLNLANLTSHASETETNAIAAEGSEVKLRHAPSVALKYNTTPTASGGNSTYPYTNSGGVVLITSYDELVAHKSQPNVTLSIQNDITLLAEVAFDKPNVTIDGNGYTIGGGFQFTLKENQQSISNLNFKGYKNAALQFWGNHDFTLTNVTFTAADDNSDARGIFVNGSNGAAGPRITIKGNFSTSKNKGAGIRVNTNPSSCAITISANATYSSTDEAVAIQILNVNDNKAVTAPGGVFAEILTSGTTKNYYTSFYEITDYDSFKNAASAGNAGRTLKVMNDITFDANQIVTFTDAMPDITLDGAKADGSGNCTIMLNGDYVALRGKQTLKNLNFKGHTAQAVSVFGNKAGVIIENVTIDGAGAANTGIALSANSANQGGKATLKNVSTSGHKSQGILVFRGSTLDLTGGGIRSENDKAALVDNGTAGVNTINFPGGGYASIYDSKAESSSITTYQMLVAKEVSTWDELKTALATANAKVTMKNDISAPDGTEDLLTMDKAKSLNGGGFKLTTGKKGMKISGQAALENITLTGYEGSSVGLTVSGGNTSLTMLRNVTLDGGDQAQAGLTVTGKAAVTLASGCTLTTQNHTQVGIRVQSASALDLENGAVKSVRDTASLNDISIEGEDPNDITFPGSSPYGGPYTYQDHPAAGTRTTKTYVIFNRVPVGNEAQLNAAIADKNVEIVLTNDFSIHKNSKYPAAGEETGEILFPSYCRLDGAGHTIQMNNQNRAADAKQVRLTFKGRYAGVRDLTVTGYLNNGLTLYRVNEAELENVTMKGIPEKSGTGLVITGTTANLSRISTMNHTGRGVQITGQTTNGVTLPSKITVKNGWSSVNDAMAIKMIVQPSDTVDCTLNDPDHLFFTGGKTQENSEKGYTYAWNFYFTGQSAGGAVSTEAALVKALSTPGSKIELKGDVTFGSALSAWKDENGKDTQLEVAPGVQLLGGGHTIHLRGKTGIIIKKGDVSFRDVTVKNGKQDGVTAYNSKNVTLTNVTLERCGRWGLVLNGSEVLVHDLTTRKNYAGGIQLSRSRTLRAASCVDSKLTVKGNIKHEEYGFNIQVKNMELLTNRYAADGTLAKNADGTLKDPVARPSRWTRNTVVRERSGGDDGDEDTIAELYRVYEEPVKYNKLSSYYIDLFDFEEEEADEYYTDPPENDRDPNTLYGEQEINYMATRHKLNVKYQDELKDGETPVRLLGSDAADPQAEKRKLERLVAFAATNGYMLYFPADTYTLCGDLDLTHLGGLPSLSNFGFVGDGDEPSILRACAGTDHCDCASKGMLRIGSFNAGDGKKDYYRYPVYYMRAENMVFDNVGIAMDSAYKRGLEVVNNVFLNGGCKGPYPKTKTIAGEEVAGTEVELFPYVTSNSIKAVITGNIFLRTQDHAGKGVSVYRSKESVISSNIFGNPKYLSNENPMFRVPGADLRLEMLREFSGRLGVNFNRENGNFFTCINAVGYDENLKIQSNYFHLEPTKNVTINNAGAVNGIHFIQGLNEIKRENWQRRDHIIYGKSYQNIYVENNYFYGQENGGAGGLKLRNGKGIYVGSNYFHNAPLLIYVYNDLAASGGSNVLADAVIYNNTFQTNSNFGKSHSCILFYQSFQNTRKEYADIRNFIMYQNRFLADYRDNVTISQNVLIGEVDRSGEFYGYGNIYACGAKNVPAAASPGIPIPWNFTGRAKVNHGDRVANGSIGWREVSQARILEQIEKTTVADHFFDPDAESAPWLNAVPAIVPPVDYGYFDQVLATAGGKVDPAVIRQAEAFRAKGRDNTQAECNLWATYLIENGADEIIPPVSGMEREPDPVEEMPDDPAEADTRFDDAQLTKDLEDKDNR